MKMYILFIMLLIGVISCKQTDKAVINSKMLVFENVNLFDGKQVHKNKVVYVIDGLIDKIDNNLDLIPNHDVELIDGKGKTLMPALINSHVHISANSQLKEAAQAGVLAVIDMFNTDVLRYKINNDSLGYAQFLSAGICVTVPKGHGTQYGVDIPTLQSISNTSEFVENRKKEGSDFIKIIIESGYPFYPVPTLSDSQLENTISSAIELNMLTVVHVSDLDDGLKAFRYGANGLAHLWTKNENFINAEQLKELNERPSFFIIPTLQVLKSSQELMKKRSNRTTVDFSRICEEVNKLHKNNVKILAGTDPPNLEINYGTDLYNELEYFVRAGMSPIESLKAATSVPAEVFQLEEIGTIELGKLANLILIKGDPTIDISDIRNIESIWQKGVQIK